MHVIFPHDREAIAAALERARHLHLYALGDLDDMLWPATTWLGLADAGGLRQVVLGYNPGDMLVVHALSEEPDELAELLRRALHLLPARFYAHLSPGVEGALADAYRLTAHGAHDKMSLTDPEALAAADTAGTELLGPGHQAEVAELYAASYPGNWFDPRMLETGRFVGLREAGRLVSIAGVHVYSPRYRVAALGNITTRPAARGRGLAGRATARLCRELLADGIATIGLNVRADNGPAIACYRRLGFARTAGYGEFTLERA